MNLRGSVHSFFFFFFNDTATTEIYTLSLHDALPIFGGPKTPPATPTDLVASPGFEDRKSTRLNSSHSSISYAVFCLKKKKQSLTHICYIKKDYMFIFENREFEVF